MGRLETADTPVRAVFYHPKNLYFGEPYSAEPFPQKWDLQDLQDLQDSQTWVNFDTSGDFSNIKEEERKCHGCLEHMGGQLLKLVYNLLYKPEEDGKVIDLGNAHGCWKVIVNLYLSSLYETMDILNEYINIFPSGRSLHGKAGGLEGRQSVVLYPDDFDDALDIGIHAKKFFRYHDCYEYHMPMNGCHDILEPIIGTSYLMGREARIEEPDTNKIAGAFMRTFWKRLGPNNQPVLVTPDSHILKSPIGQSAA